MSDHAERPSLAGRTIGVIGLGLMGKPMALALHRAGARVVVHNRSPGAVAEMVAAGLEACAEGAVGVARQADTVLLMLTDTPAVETVMDSLLPAGRPGLILLDMGTTAVDATRRLAGLWGAHGGQWVDAPVSGGQKGAVEQTLTIMAGGSQPAFSRVLPLLQVLGRHITHVGDVGAGQVTKAANQVIVGLTIGAVAEAMTLARAAGVDPGRLRTALMGGFAASRVLDLHGQRMADHAFTPGGRASVQRKDMVQALDLAAQVGVDLPATALNRQLYDALVDKGYGDLDHSALIKAIAPDGWPDPQG